MKRKFLFLLFTIMLFLGSCSKKTNDKPSWSLTLTIKGQNEIEIVRIPDMDNPFVFHQEVNGIRIDFSLLPKGRYSLFKAVANSDSEMNELFFSLKCDYGNTGVAYNFNGEVESSEIFRQSPHDVNAWITKDIAKQAVPMIAVKYDSVFYVALNGSPALYNNFTSQSFFPNIRTAMLSSGDNGDTPGLRPDTSQNLEMEYNTDKTQILSPGKILPGYHQVSSGMHHNFEGILFRSQAKNINSLRKDVNRLAADYFSGSKYTDYFGALSFTTAYMNLRVNETGKSKFWVVPSVEYGNTQYCRDAFWISTMLDPYFASECLKSELEIVDTYAEYPLVAVIWAYRAFKQGMEVDLTKVQDYVDAIETRARNNYFYSYTEKDGRLDFQYWGDVIAFDKDDVVTYNQGLFALALTAAKEMNLNIKSDPGKAQEQYRNMFNNVKGFFPVSMKKNTILGPDPLVPDLLSQLYFNKKLLDSVKVGQHYQKVIKNSKTSFGYKVVSLPNGDFLPANMYDVEDYVSQVNRENMPDGQYFKGGSYFLYDNLFLIDAYLHGIKEAEAELIWRISLDFKIGATTYECLNTITGEPWKPNMGWNVAIYSIWRQLVDNGQADMKLFNTIDSIVSL